MISRKTLNKYKLDTASLKALFDIAGKETKESKASKKLRPYIRDLIKSGVERSIAEYRTWAAVDLAHDAPFHQETPTIIRSILSSKTEAKDALKACRAWGLCEGDLFCKTKQGNEEVFELNVPAIFTTLVPVVRAYVAVRTGKLFNDRNLNPLLKFEPRYNTAVNRVRCAIWTNMVQKLADTMGYPLALQQLIFNSNMYATAFMFPMEPWHKEVQEDENGKESVQREGIRYALPHVTRTFSDLTYPLAMFNTDTGGTHAGYWTINKYRDVANNTAYWNKANITYGFDWTDKNSHWKNYFEQAYPCVLDFPKVTAATGQVTDREQAQTRYGDNDQDKSIVVTPLFLKLVPKDWDMGDYKHPVWFRFFIGADDTILHCEAFTYRATTVAQYDPDQNRAKNASLALEIIPSQDMLGNLLTQVTLTIKRNLANLTLYDTNLNITAQMEAFQRKNQWQYQGMMFAGYDSLRQKIANLPSPRDSVHTIQFPFQDTSQMLAAINTVISMLERLLVISPQEIGAAASHQQSVKEIQTITANTSNRVAYTGAFIDFAIDAWKAQLYEAMLEHTDDDFVAEISADIPELDKALTELKLTKEGDSSGARRIIVKGKKENLKLEGFATSRDGPERTPDAAAAQAQAQALASISQNPVTGQMVDAESMFEAYTDIAHMQGARDDFRLRVNKQAQVNAGVQQVAEEIKTAAVQEALAISREEIAKPAAAAVQQHTEEIAQVQQVVAQLAENMEKIQQIVLSQAQSPTPTLQPQPPNEPVLIPSPS